MPKLFANNNELASTKLFMFLAIKDLHLCMSFDIVDVCNPNTGKQILKQKAFDISGNIENTGKFAQKVIIIAQKCY